MTTRNLLALTAVGLALTFATVGRAGQEANPVATLNVPKMTDDQIALAAENLRKEGPAGLEKAQHAYWGWLISCSSGGGDPTQHVKHAPRWRRLVDLTAQQKDADVSRLFWYTDWDLARAEAERLGKPVLRLFMMGRLTDNLSCANSRFFRVALYSNERISDYLRENYVLCWTSVRPVPVITVDYGDGRKLERTITGNSIHYVVDARGQLIDAMPGLVSPDTFESWLKEGRRKHGNLAALPEDKQAEQLRSDHQDQLNDTLTSWREALGEVAAERGPAAVSVGPLSEVPASEDVAVAPTAIVAAPAAASKAFVELPLVAEVVPGAGAPQDPSANNPVPMLPPLAEGASVYGPPGIVAPPTVPAPTAVEAAPIAASKRAVEFPLVNSVVADSLPTNGATPVAPMATEAVPIAIHKGRVEQPLVAELAPPVPPEPNVPQALQPAPQNVAEALQALPISRSKTGVERPLVRTVVGREEVPRLIAETTEEDWNRIADRFLAGSRLDALSKSLMDRLHSDPQSPTDETCPSSTVESFERSIALDTARNRFLHRRTILQWILDDGLPTDLVAFNDRVYGELFLTPSSDPWIGLVPQDVFTGIEGEGLFGN